MINGMSIKNLLSKMISEYIVQYYYALRRPTDVAKPDGFQP